MLFILWKVKKLVLICLKKIQPTVLKLHFENTKVKFIKENWTILIEERNAGLCTVKFVYKVLCVAWKYEIVTIYRASWLQKENFDYTETYSPIVKLLSERIILSITVHFTFWLEQMYHKTVFLQEIAHISQPEGFEEY